MSRLTRYHHNGILVENGGYYEPDNSNYLDITNKLGKLEDIEDELGCPLDVVFKAINQNYIYIKMYDRDEYGNLYEPYELVMYKQENVVLSRTKNHNPVNKWCLSFWGGWNSLWVACVYLDEYGKNWWLKEDKSE